MGWLTAGIIWGTVILFFRAKRIGVLYFVGGAAGLAVWLTALLYNSPLADCLGRMSGAAAHSILAGAGIEALFFQEGTGSEIILLLGPENWTVLAITPEASGLLEVCGYCGLLTFFPGLGIRRKAVAGAAGIAALLGANLLRLTVIGLLIRYGGRAMIFAAHTLVSRLLYFGFTVVIYWFVFTGPTLQAIRRKITDVH